MYKSGSSRSSGGCLHRRCAAAAVARKTPAVTAVAGAQTTINNQLQAVAAMARVMVTMTATMTTMKTKVVAAEAAAATAA